MSSCDVSSCTLLDEDCVCLKGFNISFSWDYPDNWCLKDVKETVFHILDANDNSKPDNQTLINVVQSSGSGVVLTQPNPERDVIPCELNLRAHPDSIQFCITNILVVSEARHIELYINDMYDKTTKGSVLSMKKGRKAAIYESQLDLSAHVQGTQKVTLKFLSLADKESLRLQAIVLTIIECANTDIPKKSVSSTNVHSVREMIKSMNLQVTDNAEKLMKDIESQQKQNQLLFQNLLQSGTINPQQLYQIPSNLIPSQVATSPNLFTHQLGAGQHILQNVAPPQSGIPQLNNLNLPPQVAMPHFHLSHQHTHSAIENTCCLHSLPHQHTSHHQHQQQSFALSSPYIHDEILSKSCPGSRNRSPTQRFTHSQVYSPVGHVISRSLCDTPIGFMENGISPTQPPVGLMMGRSACGTPNSFVENGCFGAPNPPNESVLANAILNERPSKEISKNRISMIEHENFHEAQLQLQNTTCQQSENSLSRGGVKLRHADNVSRKCLDDRKRRAKSLCLMPTESEMDFSQLLTEIIKDETHGDSDTKGEDPVDESELDTKISARWESYLRSRVRVSRRNSDPDVSPNDSTEAHNDLQHGHGETPTSVKAFDDVAHSSDTLRCTECGCSGCHKILEDISKSLVSMEQKLNSHIDVKMAELRLHLDKRLDTLVEIINVPQPYDYDETLCSNTEV